jgi:hypothetical protein
MPIFADPDKRHINFIPGDDIVDSPALGGGIISLALNEVDRARLNF